MYRRRVRGGLRRTAELRGPHDGAHPGTWSGIAHVGKFWRRLLHKAERSCARGHTRERSVAHLVSMVCWKGS